VDLRGLREVLDVMSHKWDLDILTQLHERPLRYSELAHQIRTTAADLNEGVLSKNLKRLKANGLIQQTSLGNHHHVWALTPRGAHMIMGLAQITSFQTEPEGSDVVASTRDTQEQDIGGGRGPR
jgi:DNA-binding HxlR family transcriptional regulator